MLAGFPRRHLLANGRPGTSGIRRMPTTTRTTWQTAKSASHVSDRDRHKIGAGMKCHIGRAGPCRRATSSRDSSRSPPSIRATKLMFAGAQSSPSCMARRRTNRPRARQRPVVGEQHAVMRLDVSCARPRAAPAVEGVAYSAIGMLPASSRPPRARRGPAGDARHARQTIATGGCACRRLNLRALPVDLRVHLISDDGLRSPRRASCPRGR